MMTDDHVRLRAACDRCHSQKLRCPKPPDAPMCDRCKKAGSPCLFSPFRQKKEPKDKNVMIAQLSNLENRITTFKDRNYVTGSKRKRGSSSTEKESLLSNLEVDVLPSQPSFDPTGNDWMTSLFEGQDFEIDPAFTDIPFDTSFPTLDYATLPPLHDSSSGNTSMVRVNSPPSFNPPVFANSSGNFSLRNPPIIPASNTRASKWKAWESGITTVHIQSEKHLIHKLSTLIIELYDHINTIPPQSIHQPDPKCTSAERDYDVLLIYQEFSIDETFKLTQDLIDIYPEFIRTFVKWQISSDDWITPESLDMQESGAIVPTSEELAGRNLVDKSPKHLDHSSILLLLSCHVRLIDIYDELFKHMEICFAQEEMTKTAAQARYVPPPLKIGSYQPPLAAAVPMQMLLLVQLSSQLSNSASELAMQIREWQSPQQSPSSVISPRNEAAMLSLVTAEKVTERATNMSAQLTNVRMRLLGSGFIA